MFEWLKPKKEVKSDQPLNSVMRVITTKRGTAFEVFAETPHYIMCNIPETRDAPSDAILDFEELAQQGYWLCYAHKGLGALIMFEKRK